MMRAPPRSFEMPRARALFHKLRAIPVRLRRVTYDLRTEGGGTARETAAIGVGVFIGCLPFYGFHLLMCAAAGSLMRLNRLKVYLAANISNPFVAPWLLLAEVQTGAWLRRGSFHALTRATIETTDLWVFGADLLMGSVVVGATLAVLAAGATYGTMWQRRGDLVFPELVRRASDRYAGTSITAWEFARGKLRHDPLYRAAVCEGLLSSGRTLVDIGCGQGLTLALLVEARRLAREGAWPQEWPAAPCFEKMVGVETRANVAALARGALADEAEIVTSDARATAPIHADAILVFDVLHMMRAEDQDTLIAKLAASLEPGGVMFVREADASAGWRFLAVRMGNRLKALLVGAFRQEFHFRTESDWQACFARHGLRADVRPMGQGTPFGNVLFRLTLAATAT